MQDKFFITKFCDRCYQPLNGARTMSRFNKDCICLKCAKEEREHPLYKVAVEAEMEAIRQGNYNFKGIGWKK